MRAAVLGVTCPWLLTAAASAISQPVQCLRQTIIIETRTNTVQTPSATHPRARQVQSGMPGSPVAVRAGASLLGRRLLSRVRQHSALSAVS